MGRPRVPTGQWGTIEVTKQGDKWMARTRIRDVDGRVRRVTRWAPTKTKAEAALRAELLDRSVPSRSAVLTRRNTVAEAAELWLVEVVNPSDLALNTKRAYASVMATHVSAGPLAAVQLDEISVARMETTLRKVAIESGPSAAKTLRTVYRSIFDLAVRHGAVETNCVRLLGPIRVQATPTHGRRVKDRRRALSRPEREALLDFLDTDEHAKTYDLADLAAFLAATGCRIGEACALRWKSVQLPEAKASIVATAIRVKGQGMIIQEHTKGRSEYGNRTVHLPDWMVDRLQRRRAAPLNHLELVFPSPLGKLRDPSNTQHRLREAFDAAGFEWMTSHTFRRTAATWMDEAGFTPREVANQLGHARVSMAQDVYMDRRASVERASQVL